MSDGVADVLSVIFDAQIRAFWAHRFLDPEWTQRRPERRRGRCDSPGRRAQLEYAVNTAAGQGCFPHQAVTRRAFVHAANDAGALAPCVFAHHHHIDIAGQPRAAVATHQGGSYARHEPRRAQVDVVVKLGPQRQQQHQQRRLRSGGPPRKCSSNCSSPCSRIKRCRRETLVDYLTRALISGNAFCR